MSDETQTTDRIIERAGGWRLFMREAAENMSIGEPVLDIEAIRRCPQAALGRAFFLAKSGSPEMARRQLDAFHDAMGPPDVAAPPLADDFTLVDTHVCVYEDKALDGRYAARLERILGTLPESDLIGKALAHNHLSTVALHLGDFDKAQEHAEAAMHLFRQDGAEFGSLHLHTHLGQIRLMRGDISGARQQYREMEERLALLPERPIRLLAVSRVLRSEVAYEMNDLTASRSLLDDAMQSVEHSDAWLDILAAAYRVQARLAFASAGLPGALTALSHAEHSARGRSMPRLSRLMQIERIRALTLSNELDAALAEMRAIGLSPEQPDLEETDDWALRQGTTMVALARWMVRARRAQQALNFLLLAEDFAIRGGQLLTLAKLRVIRAAADWRLNRRREATDALMSAFRLLGNQPFRRFILDEGPETMAIVQAALNGDYATRPPGPAFRRRLAHITHHWATHTETAGDGDNAAPVAAKLLDTRGGGHRQRYLELLARGFSNKEIASIMGVSVNTVKYHLKQVFKELQTDNRLRAVQRARELGIIDT